MDDLSKADISQQYLGNVILFAGVLSYVDKVNEDSSVNLRDVKTRVQTRYVPFSRALFKTPTSRLGMCTDGVSTAYISRIPVRKMGIGISRENLSVKRVGNTSYLLLDAVDSLLGQSVYNTFMGVYLTLPEAFDAAVHAKGVVAFDRQMAVDFEGFVYYKTDKVGRYKHALSTPKIVFSTRYSYLNKIMNVSYETAV